MFIQIMKNKGPPLISSLESAMVVFVGMSCLSWTDEFALNPDELHGNTN